ncbi:hypothetical protein G8C93_02885 [Cellulosimicrobium cellulans]|uniref:hypothetical protein n=1 Tax=Cellulosimicrobium cellulans TaxID=1710 RepID=UPI0018835262|nr:hypothetical protein [Cellulosimicrobium cellulans]MBE9924837.1 hypothetical protein [Cellulosimicrobium cellulans]
MTTASVKTEDVFTPGKNTTLTYVERQHEQAVRDLRRHIRRGGVLVSVIGPTKMGKTVLVQREAPHAFVVHGNAIENVDDFWERFAAFLEIPLASTRTTVVGDKSKWGFFGKLGLFGVGETGANVGGEHTVDKGTSTTSTMNADQAALQAVKTIRDGGGKITIVVDDFHFIPEPVRKGLVQALKPIAFAGATIILITLPHRRTETSDLVTDMSGRTATVEINPWNTDDLATIATLGFEKLNLVDGREIADRLAEASYGSPQIMQQLCLELCETVNDILEAQGSPTLLVEPADWAEFHREVRDDAAVKWVHRFIAGPLMRGKKRNLHELTDGRVFDGYQVILAALKELGPPLDLTVPVLTAQIDKMLKDTKANALAVGKKLSQMSTLAAKPLSAKLAETDDEDATANLLVESDDDPASGTPQPVFEYVPDAVGPTIHILEPYLAYTIRWHSEDLLKESMAPVAEQGSATGPTP